MRADTNGRAAAADQCPGAGAAPAGGAGVGSLVAGSATGGSPGGVVCAPLSDAGSGTVPVAGSAGAPILPGVSCGPGVPPEDTCGRPPTATGGSSWPMYGGAGSGGGAVIGGAQLR